MKNFFLNTLIKFKRYFLYELSNIINLKKQNVELEENVKIRGKIYIKNHGSLIIKQNTTINSGKNFNSVGYNEATRIYISRTGSLCIGKNVGISNTNIFSQSEIKIGDNVQIGGGTNIWDTDFHSIDFKERIIEKDSNVKSKPIIIEKNAFIGANVTILKGVTIGEGAVIGAGSIVSKSIPSNEIWAGNPIHFIKRCNKNDI